MIYTWFYQDPGRVFPYVCRHKVVMKPCKRINASSFKAEHPMLTFLKQKGSEMLAFWCQLELDQEKKIPLQVIPELVFILLRSGHADNNHADGYQMNNLFYHVIWYLIFWVFGPLAQCRPCHAYHHVIWFHSKEFGPNKWITFNLYIKYFGN